MNTRTYYALCVDDEQAVLNQLEVQLTDHFEDSCEIELAESAEEALEIYEDLVEHGERIWLVISDQVMPGMSGDELLARIHEDDHRIIKVLLTGQAGVTSTIRAINHAGLNYYIEKPWVQEDLLLVLDKLKFQYEMTTLLNEMNLLFASSIELDETLSTVFYNILNAIQAEAGSIFLFEDSREELVCRICQGPKDILGVRVPVGKGIVGYVAQSRRIDVTTDVKHDERHYGQIDEQSGFVTKSMISVPLISKDEVLGVIQVINKKGGKTFSQTDVTLLQALSSGGALALQNATYARRLVQEERTRSELLIAHQIQQGILPPPFQGHPSIHFSAFNASAKVVGGDFYDYFQVNDDEFGFFIGDVCGKGIPAAIFMASSRSIIKSQTISNPNPSNVLRFANQLIAEDVRHGIFVTAFYGLYNIKTRKLRFANAGHTLPYLYRSSTSSCASLFKTSFPLGVLESSDSYTFQESEVQLEQGDILVLYTDGISEALNRSREQFGLERLVNIIFEYGHRSPQELRDKIIESVKNFSEDQGLIDDITVMIVQV